LLVPIIVFESAFNANYKALMGNLLAALFLVIPAMLFAAGLTWYSLWNKSIKMGFMQSSPER